MAATCRAARRWARWCAACCASCPSCRACGSPPSIRSRSTRICWRLIAEEPRLMPHLHLSLQAGDDLILKRMKRRHSRADAVAAAARARDLRPGIALGADLIAGFPTETEAMFERSLALDRGLRPRLPACLSLFGPRRHAGGAHAPAARWRCGASAPGGCAPKAAAAEARFLARQRGRLEQRADRAPAGARPWRELRRGRDRRRPAPARSWPLRITGTNGRRLLGQQQLSQPAA